MYMYANVHVLVCERVARGRHSQLVTRPGRSLAQTELGIRNLHHAPPDAGLFDETRGYISYRESSHACMEQQVASKAAMMSDFQPPP